MPYPRSGRQKGKGIHVRTYAHAAAETNKHKKAARTTDKRMNARTDGYPDRPRVLHGQAWKPERHSIRFDLIVLYCIVSSGPYLLFLQHTQKVRWQVGMASSKADKTCDGINQAKKNNANSAARSICRTEFAYLPTIYIFDLTYP